MSRQETHNVPPTEREAFGIDDLNLAGKKTSGSHREESLFLPTNVDPSLERAHEYVCGECEFLLGLCKCPKQVALKVLIMDDSPLQAEAVKLMCKKEGLMATAVVTPEDAIRHIEQQQVDILLVDYHQPAPFDCLQFLENCVQGQIAAIVISADQKVKLICDSVYFPSIEAFFAKPITLKHVRMFAALKHQHETRWRQRLQQQQQQNPGTQQTLSPQASLRQLSSAGKTDKSDMICFAHLQKMLTGRFTVLVRAEQSIVRCCVVVAMCDV
jgi:CheY-like chemotaxis protein